MWNTHVAGVEVCSFHPPSKKCIVSKPDGEDRTRSDVIYMAKVEIDDPFVEPDPFAETNAEAKEACLAREAALESELAECKATAAAAGSGSSHPSCAQCGILGKNGPGPFLSASEDRFGRLQGRMRRRWRRYAMSFLRP
nr:hypothetical protein FVER53263_08688 [Fusarium verticillioides]